jgi:hypothetical protein
VVEQLNTIHKNNANITHNCNMITTDVTSLFIKSQQGKRLKKEQVRFNKLVKQIEQLQSRTATIENNLQIARLVYNVTLQPLINKWLQLKVKRLQVLDALIEKGDSATINANKAQQLLLKEAKELAEVYNHHVAKELFDKYNTISFNTLHQQSLAELMQLAKAHLKEMGMATIETVVRPGSVTVPALIEVNSGLPNTSKSVTGLLKKIYLRLVQEYHPDKYSGIEAEKVTREANEAYRNNTFYQLLKLEKQYLQQNVGQLTTPVLNEYNNLLEEDVKAYKLRLATAENKYGLAFYEKFGSGGVKLKMALDNEKTILTWRLQQLEYNWNDFGSFEK